MTNEQQLRLEILELRLAMAALERVAARQQETIDTLERVTVRQQQTIDLLRERAASESIKRGAFFDAMMDLVMIEGCDARN